MKRITIPIIAVGLLILAACSLSVTDNGLPPGRFAPPSWLHGTWRLHQGAALSSKYLQITATTIHTRTSVSNRLEDLSVAWQDWTIKETESQMTYEAEGFDPQGIRKKITATSITSPVPGIRFTRETYSGSPRSRVSKISGIYVKEAE